MNKMSVHPLSCGLRYTRASQDSSTEDFKGGLKEEAASIKNCGKRKVIQT
jgi:hypothetical protein